MKRFLVGLVLSLVLGAGVFAQEKEVTSVDKYTVILVEHYSDGTSFIKTVGKRFIKENTSKNKKIIKETLNGLTKTEPSAEVEKDFCKNLSKQVPFIFLETEEAYLYIHNGVYEYYLK